MFWRHQGLFFLFLNSWAQINKPAATLFLSSSHRSYLFHYPQETDDALSTKSSPPSVSARLTPLSRPPPHPFTPPPFQSDTEAAVWKRREDCFPNPHTDAFPNKHGSQDNAHNLKHTSRQGWVCFGFRFLDLGHSGCFYVCYWAPLLRTRCENYYYYCFIFQPVRFLFTLRSTCRTTTRESRFCDPRPEEGKCRASCFRDSQVATRTASVKKCREVNVHSGDTTTLWAVLGAGHCVQHRLHVSPSAIRYGVKAKCDCGWMRMCCCTWDAKRARCHHDSGGC